MITKPDSQLIPRSPGSYQFKDAFGRVIYVGKAKVLRSRINSYFQPIDNTTRNHATNDSRGSKR